MHTFIYNEEFKRELREDPHPFGEVSLLESAAEPGMTALDIGANKGLTTIALARKVGRKGRVYAFEPVPQYYRMLRANLSNNDVHNVKTYRLALGDSIGQTDYYKDGGGSGIVRQNGAEKLSVQVTTLDKFMEKEAAAHVDLINMDCEGSELLALKGGKRTLASGPVKIFCEIHRGRLAELGQSLDELVRWLDDRGFDVKPVLVDDLEKDVSYEDCTHIFACRETDAPGPAAKVQRLEEQLADLE